MFHWLEKNPFLFAVAVFVVFSIAGLVDILPHFAKASRPVEGQQPYSLLALAGRQVYIKDSCNACHSQLIRPFKSETDRYGTYSLSGEYAYDRPFLWGSKRTGPDLMRVGNYRSTDWHENHMYEPASVVPGSIMPAYKHMFSNNIDMDTVYAEAYTVKSVFNVPYNQAGMPSIGANVEEARKLMLAEAEAIVAGMKTQDVKDALKNGEIKEIVALIAYLNSLK